MWFSVSILLCIFSGLLIILIFGLMKAGRRADDIEEKITDSIGPASTQQEEIKAKTVTISPKLTKPKFRTSIDN